MISASLRSPTKARWERTAFGPATDSRLDASAAASPSAVVAR